MMESLQDEDEDNTITLEELLELAKGDFKQLYELQVHFFYVYQAIEWKGQALAPGYKDAQDLLCKHIPELTRAELNAYARLFSGVDYISCVTYGPKRLRALRTYASLAGVTLPSWGDPGETPVQVPQQNGSTIAKPFSSCNLKELQRAVQHKRRLRKERPPVSDSVQWLYLGDSIRQHFQGVANVRTNVRSDNGVLLVTMQDVPLREMERLIQALQAGLDAQPFALRDDTKTPA